MMTAGDPQPRTRWWSSLRWRIVTGYVLLLAAALAISILVTRQVLVGRLDREVDRSLTQEVEEMRNVATGDDPATGEPFGDDTATIFDTFLRGNIPITNEAFYTLVDGERYLSSFDAPQELWEDDGFVADWAAVTTPTTVTTTSSLGEVRYLAVPLLTGDTVSGVFVVVNFLDNDRDDIAFVVRVLIAAGLVVLVATAALAWSIAGRVLRPVRDLTTTAHQISDTDLTKRIEVTGNDEIAKLGATFNEMVDRLEDGFAHQREFLDDVAHELRTPITIVQGHVDVLGDDPDERADSVATITDELDRMNRYVDDLLLLAKAESGQFLRFAPVDLGELAEIVDQRVRPLGVRDWVLDAAPQTGTVAFLGDRDRLLQAMLNLATNAVQHTADGDQIGIGVAAEPGDSMAQLWVRDTGPGLDPDTIDQLFTRRFRSAASRARRSEGMGIGLSIVDAIARGHGGRAIAANEPDGGARFTIELPIETETEDVP